jgi:hypothetical protein
LYQYVNGMPLFALDPSGERSFADAYAHYWNSGVQVGRDAGNAAREAGKSASQSIQNATSQAGASTGTTYVGAVGAWGAEFVGDTIGGGLNIIGGTQDRINDARRTAKNAKSAGVGIADFIGLLDLVESIANVDTDTGCEVGTWDERLSRGAAGFAGTLGTATGLYGGAKNFFSKGPKPNIPNKGPTTKKARDTGNPPKNASCDPTKTCFTAGTVVATSSGLKPIESLKVGERVLTSHAESLPTQVDPATWRKVSLLLPNDDGSPDVFVMEVLWPQTKIAQLGVAPGKAVPLAIEELGVEGTATVTAVEPCPPVTSGPGRVVVATINHLNAHVLQLDLKGLDAPLEATKEHPFYSLDRDAWIPAGRLQVGERLATVGGETKLTAVRRKPGTHRVYNLTVEYEHLYIVSKIGLLSHNVQLCNIKDGDSLSTDDALDLAQDSLGPGYKEVGPGVFKSADGKIMVRITDSDLAKKGNHAGAPHMNIETGVTVKKPNGKESFIPDDNKHIFLPEEK